MMKVWILLDCETLTHCTIREDRELPRQPPVVDELAPVFQVRADAPPLLLEFMSGRSLK